jgi:hypothetical protein
VRDQALDHATDLPSGVKQGTQVQALTRNPDHQKRRATVLGTTACALLLTVMGRMILLGG